MKVHNNNINNWIFCNKLELYRHRNKLFKILKIKNDINSISIWDDKIIGKVISELNEMKDVDWKIWTTIKESDWKEGIPSDITRMMGNNTTKL